MKSRVTMLCLGRYLGKDGMMGLKKGEVYTVEVFIREGRLACTPIICVARAGDPQYYLPYRSMKRFQRSWDFIDV